MTVEVRYIGTKGTKIWSNVDLNRSVGYEAQQPALFDAFNAARAGGESALLNQMLNGVALTGGCGVVNGTTCTGAADFPHQHHDPRQLANGNFGRFLNSLNTTLKYTGGSTGRRIHPPSCRASRKTTWFRVRSIRACNIAGNNQNSTYHSLNLQFTRRSAQWLHQHDHVDLEQGLGVRHAPSIRTIATIKDPAGRGSHAPDHQ